MSVRARDAVLPVDKPEGPTSHDVVAQARKALRERRIGHTGTLDPFASGLLLLCVGRATRLSQFLTGMDKTYEATARLGVTTDSEDRDGAVVSSTDAWRDVTDGRLEEVVASLRGEISQVPPSFSAKKIEGEAAHRRVRRGEEVTLAPVTITVHELAVLAFEPPDVRLRVRCSTGTYVRSLARDLGVTLGVGAHLTTLRRTAIGAFDVADAIAPEALSDPGRLDGAWIDPLDALAHLPRVDVDAESSVALAHGREIPVDGAADGLTVAAYAGTLLAIGEVGGGRFRPNKVFQS